MSAPLKTHDAIKVILLVNTETPAVSISRRDGGGGWLIEVVEGFEAAIPLPEIEAELPLAELYLDMRFDEA